MSRLITARENNQYDCVVKLVLKVTVEKPSLKENHMGFFLDSMIGIWPISKF